MGFERAKRGVGRAGWRFGAELQAQKSRRTRSADSITLCEADYMQTQPYINSSTNIAPRFSQSENVARKCSYSVQLAA